ncbi:hypothetical protein JTE90_014235 [Oedothorax gibbosus]|uniref:Uncharacterized protein n=1 Tax=Oedothorax gibbosus TaxID=931172 RepID=A0AAV6TCQ1_9ARAC|nr:hypothetical protein JTE90_014235 [Oedothorax gibbosus]
MSALRQENRPNLKSSLRVHQKAPMTAQTAENAAPGRVRKGGRLIPRKNSRDIRHCRELIGWGVAPCLGPIRTRIYSRRARGGAGPEGDQRTPL